MQAAASVIVASLATVGCGSLVRGASTRSVPASQAESAVYAAMLTTALPQHVEYAPVVARTTIRYRPVADNRRRPGEEPIPPELMADLDSLSRRPWALDSAFFLRPVQFVGRREGLRIAARGLGGAKVVFVTPVAFNADQSQALVYHEIECGGLRGGGYTLWLERNGRVAGRRPRRIVTAGAAWPPPRNHLNGHGTT